MLKSGNYQKQARWAVNQKQKYDLQWPNDYGSYANTVVKSIA